MEPKNEMPKKRRTTRYSKRGQKFTNCDKRPKQHCSSRQTGKMGTSTKTNAHFCSSAESSKKKKVVKIPSWKDWKIFTGWCRDPSYMFTPRIWVKTSTAITFKCSGEVVFFFVGPPDFHVVKRKVQQRYELFQGVFFVSKTTGVQTRGRGDQTRNFSLPETSKVWKQNSAELLSCTWLCACFRKSWMVFCRTKYTNTNPRIGKSSHPCRKQKEKKFQTNLAEKWQLHNVMKFRTCWEKDILQRRKKAQNICLLAKVWTSPLAHNGTWRQKPKPLQKHFVLSWCLCDRTFSILVNANINQVHISSSHDNFLNPFPEAATGGISCHNHQEKWTKVTVLHVLWTDTEFFVEPSSHKKQLIKLVCCCPSVDTFVVFFFFTKYKNLFHPKKFSLPPPNSGFCLS